MELRTTRELRRNEQRMKSAAKPAQGEQTPAAGASGAGGSASSGAGGGASASAE